MQGCAACPHVNTNLLAPCAALQERQQHRLCWGSALHWLQRAAHSSLLGNCARIIIYMCWHKVIANGAEHHARPLQAVAEDTLRVTKQSTLSMSQTRFSPTPVLLPPATGAAGSWQRSFSPALPHPLAFANTFQVCTQRM